MKSRYEVRLNKETYLYDIWDLVLGDRLFCSFKTEERANEVAKIRNTEYETYKMAGFQGIPYKGDIRNSVSAPYRTPKIRFSVNGGLVTFYYE